MTRRRRRVIAVAATVAVTAAALVSCRAHGGTGPPPAPPTITSGGWRVSLYFTSVESLHHGRPRAVTGCRDLHCVHGDAPLGTYPADFVRAVRAQGSGKITRGPHAGRFLDWSSDTGYWLDSTPRDARGRPLEPFRTVAAGLPDGTRIELTGCGHRRGGRPVPHDLCRRLTAAHWQVRDVFPGDRKTRAVDLYIGPETTAGFAGPRRYTTLRGVTLTVAVP